MNEMVERIAFALYVADGFQRAIGTAEQSWANERDGVKARYRQTAKAVGAAMREPTPQMIEAYTLGHDDPHGGMLAIAVWRAMIDAALTE